MPSRIRADFEPGELPAVLALYDLGQIQRIERQIKGSRRAPKVIIISDRGQFLLKRRAKGRDHPVKVSFSHAVQQHLAACGFPLPRLVGQRDSGETLTRHGERIYEVFEFVAGTAFDGSLDATLDAGQVLGQFHCCLRDYRSDWEPSRRGYHDANVVRGNLNGVPASLGKDDSVAGRESELLAAVSMLYDAYESASERVNEAGFYEWRHQVVHSDWHPGNMLFSSGRVAAVIDYDSLHLLPAVTDLANGALQFSIIGGPMDPRRWPAEPDELRLRQFMQGYGRSCSREPEQLQALPSLMIEALIAEAVLPIAATGSFGRMEGFRFLQMICRKVRWLEQNADRIRDVLRAERTPAGRG